MSRTNAVSVDRYLLRQERPDDQEPGPWVSIFNATLSGINSVDDSGPVPDYKWRIANQVSATSSLFGVEQIFRGTHPGRIYVHRTFGGFVSVGYETIGHFGGIPYVPGDPVDYVILSVQNQAKQKIIQQIISANTSLKGLVSAGEFGETVRLVNGAGRDLVFGLRNYLGDVSRFIRYVHPKRLVDTISRRWLEYSFGWKPLISDIDDGLRALRRIREKRPPRVLVRAEASSMEKYPSESYSYHVHDYEIYVLTERESHYGSRYYGCVSVTQGVDRIPHEFGFKLDQFVPTVWELIPYSFLADYFVNIGAIIEFYALNTSGVKWLNAGTMASNKVITTPSAVFRPLDGWEYQENSILLDKPLEHTYTAKTRVGISPDLLAPSLEFRIPGSSTKWVNIAALAAQHNRTSRDLRAVRL